jgi:dihydropteroate synthase
MTPANPYLPATLWKLRTLNFRFSGRPVLMGIVNVTPDSFSDGGQFIDSGAAIEHALRLSREGAAILDIGGESTRPYADLVEEQEELGRVVPVIAEIRRELPTAIVSIDTSKAAVAKAAIDLGVEIVNDVTGLTGDPQMMDVVRQSGVGVCAMHMRGTPQTMQDDPKYIDVVGEIHEYLRERRDALLAAGIARERICLDPGIGFGKTHEHNITLMANTWRFHDLGCPLLVGHSRKGFIAKLIGDKEADRTAGTIGGALALARQQVQVIRVHDVAAVRQALDVFMACGGK